MESRDILIALSVKYQGRFDSILKAIQNREQLSDADVNQLKSQVDSQEMVITMIDKEYPEKLKKVRKPPFVIYVKTKGTPYSDADHLTKAFNNKTIAMVGRGGKLPAWEEGMINVIGHHENNTTSITVNSLDGVSREFGKTNAPEKSIIVCGCGLDEIDVTYVNATNGFYISEYPDGITPSVEIYKERARIVAGISDTVIGVDLVDKSPAVETLRIAASTGGKKVFIASSDSPSECAEQRDAAFNVNLANEIHATILTNNNYKEEIK